MATDPAATESPVAAGQDLAPAGAGEKGVKPGTSPSRIALRRLGRNRAAVAFGILFLLLVGACLAAPLWAQHVAHTRPETNHLTDTIVVDGKRVNVVSLDGIPIGPTWQGKFFMGADDNGRDVMVRLLYGGRNSLVIGIGAALMTTLLSIVVGLVSGYFRGWTDGIITRLLDIIWAFPVILLGVSLGVALATGLTIGPLDISGESIFIPMLVIAFVYVPYMARPVRAQVLALREKEFVEAARAQGAGPVRIMFTELLPNLASTILVFFTLMVANAILLESALSFLGAGVRPPATSWGTLIDQGVERITSAEHLTVVPGIMLVLTVLSLNVFGDGVRDALDPRAKVRLEH